MVAEAGDEFAKVEFALGSQIATVERGWHFAVFIFASVTAVIVVVFSFLELEVEEESFALSVSEDDVPLIELGAIVVEFFVAENEGPDVISVTSGIIGEEGEDVHAFSRELVQRSDEAFAFAFAVFPSGVALGPVLQMGPR